jgi:hypothetical protein
MRQPLAIDPECAALVLMDLQEEQRHVPHYAVDGIETVLANGRRRWTPPVPDRSSSSTPPTSATSGRSRPGRWSRVRPMAGRLSATRIRV